ncbi:putative polyketide synthase [Xylariales sp. PMI_506]|nr:putative polyketide synthase [Xylariales sp. PMI_506]
MAMRLPGQVRSGDDFWNMLSQKRSGLCDVPKNRFNINGFYGASGTPGTIPVKQGYFLDTVEIEQFDSSVFPISKKELERLDPAQRQLLQVAYECFEDAGVCSWRGSNTGCYVGEFGEDWSDVNSKETQHRGGYRGTGFGDFAMSNRISYEFGLHGPSMTVKTACSSSLVALDLACRAIGSGECEVALVGGVSLIFSPTAWMALNDQQVLSPRGMCSTFDASADGYARGEAVNMILVKKLSHALRDNDPIRAIIRGSAVNSNGRTNGLLTPNPAAQEALIRRTYAAAGIKDLSETALFECHGTGTPVGDPLETEAVASCFGEKGIIITAVKPNVGHSEAASGLTSLIKNILALEHQMVLPNINFTTPNPKIPFEKCRLRVPVDLEPWPKNRAERVSINSFGIGGANAHVIIESNRQFGLVQRDPVADDTISNGAIANAARAHGNTSSHLLLLSAYSTASLDAQVEAYHKHMETHEVNLGNLAYTLANKREHRPYRAYAVAGEVAGFDASAVETTAMPSSAPRVGWIFTGQGAQWPSMAVELIRNNVTFRGTIRKLDKFLLTLPTPPAWSIEDELCNAERDSGIHRAELSHPLCVAVQIGIVDLLRSWDVVPDFVLGHSSGEYGAAYASGAITAEAAIAAATVRGSSNATTDQRGSMAAVGLGREEVLPYLEPGVDIACENSHLSVTLSGDTTAIENVIERLKVAQPDVFTRMLRVEKAYHSHHMLQYGPSFEESLKLYITSVDPPIPLYSSVTSRRLSGKHCLDAPYWRANMERPVLFNSALRSALHDQPGDVLLIEIGPHTALAGPIGQILRDLGRTDVTYAGTMVRSKNCYESLLNLAGKLYRLGVPMDYKVVCPPGSFVKNLPRYAWKQSTGHWGEPRVSREWRMRENPPHELLGDRLFEVANEPTWRKVLALGDAPWLAGHEVNGQVIFPAAGYMAMVGEAIQQLTEETVFSIKNMRIAAACVLEMDKEVELVTNLKPMMVDTNETSPWYEFTVSSWNGTKWTKNCFGEVRGTADKSFGSDVVQAHVGPFPRRVDEQSFYDGLRQLGFNYTGLFKGIQSVSAAVNTTRAKATVMAQAEGARTSRYVLHPAVIDQCFQLFMVASFHGLRRNIDRLTVPTFIEEIVISHNAKQLAVTAEVCNAHGWGSFNGNLLAQDNDGQPAISLKGLKTKALTNNDSAEDEVPLITQFEWRPHSDFEDLGRCLRRRESREKEWPLLEELITLCMFDHRERIRIDDTTAGHLVKFYTWMEEHIQRYQSGDNLFVPQHLHLEEKNTDQRLVRIEEIMEEIKGSPSVVFGTAIQRIFEAGPSIFIGETHPLHVLLKDNVLAEFYEAASLDSSDMIRLLGNTNPRMRILEIGAGTGGTTGRVLRALTSSYGERLYSLYSYTDVSAGFMTAAKEKFSGFEGIEYGVLDVTEDPAEQGFELGSYDLIIAANVVHATPCLNTSLCNLRKLLKPGGRLFLEELCPDIMFFSYVMGFFPGWWHGAADNRVDKPWISPQRWARELVSAGFQEPDFSVLDDDTPYHANAGIIVSCQSMLTKPSRVTILCHSLEAPYTYEMRRSLDAHGVLFDIRTFGEAVPSGQDVISLLDLQEPVLHEMSEEVFNTVMDYVRSQRTHLIWATRASQVVCEDPRAAMVLGLARTARKELSLSFLTVEIDSETTPLDATDAVARILFRARSSRFNPGSSNPDYEYAVVNGNILVPRLHWQTMSKAAEQIIDARESEELAVRKRLTMKTPGLVNTMGWGDAEVRNPAEGEVLIETKAVGLNFRDILIALGALEFDPSEMGFEGSGIIRAVGAGVSRFAVGDRIMYLSTSCFTTLHTMTESLCFKMEDSMSFEQAAVIPLVYATAMLALVDKANLQKGQSVLIHAACGGVGMAAIQIAQMIGAEIYCTVGSEAKRRYLKDNYGIQDCHIFNSRDASFLPDVMRATNQRGVDVVLNSLSGDLLLASWKCVAEFGIMIEIGKRDYLRRAKLPMEVFEANRSFTGVEIRLVSEKHIQRAAAILKRCVEYIQDGKIAGPHVSTVYEAAEVQDAFRHMETAKHIGKIAIQMPSDPHDLGKNLPSSAEAVVPKSKPVFRSDRTYLLTGGLGGLGKSLATWMVEKGARSLILLSRSAKEGPETNDFVEEMNSVGCEVLLIAGSVASKSDVQRAVDNTITAAKPLAGVMNLSMVLKDVGINDMSFADWDIAVQPKVRGTWNLHEATSSLGLDFFVLFSSYGGIVGQEGQANYSAANTFMDAFTQFRHHNGMVASVINIGVVGEVGYVSRNQDVLDRLTRNGMRILHERELLAAIKLSIDRSHPATTRDASIAAAADGAAARRASGETGNTTYTNSSQLLVGLNTAIPMSSSCNRVGWKHDARMGIYHNLERLSGTVGATSRSNRTSLQSQLASSPDQESRTATIARALARALADLLIKDEDSITLDRPLESLGMDSLVAMEVRNWVRHQLGVELSTISIVQSPSLLSLAAQVQQDMAGAAGKVDL